MSWFLFAAVSMLGWGTADLFYKKSSDGTDRYSHLKISVWVGLVMGICAVGLLPFSESLMSGGNILSGMLSYSPASLSYILSMVIGYAGLRYLELSIVSPVQNASGAFSAVCIIIYFTVTGRITDIGREFSVLDLIGTLLIVIGMILLAIAEQKLSLPDVRAQSDKKYRYGALSLIFPLLYCVFDTLGTAADGIILDCASGAGLGEIDVIILYGFTFLLFGAGCFIFLAVKEKKIYNPFKRSEAPKAYAALCEEFGQIFYVYAMAKNPVIAAPMVASYCIVSVLLSRTVLKEKLNVRQYICIAAVICGIVLLGISEGLSEA